MDEVNIATSAAKWPFVLKLVFSGQETSLEWPVERDTSKARLVTTPGAPVWIPDFRASEVTTLHLGSNAPSDSKFDQRVRAYVDRLVALTASSTCRKPGGLVETYGATEIRSPHVRLITGECKQ